MILLKFEYFFSDFKISLLSFVFSSFTNIFLSCDFIYLV